MSPAEYYHAPKPNEPGHALCGARDRDADAGPTVNLNYTPFPADVTCPDCRAILEPERARRSVEPLDPHGDRTRAAMAVARDTRTLEAKQTGPFELHYLELNGPRCGSRDDVKFPENVVGSTDERLVTCSACVPGARSRLGGSAADPLSVEQARKCGVCRICREPVHDGSGTLLAGKGNLVFDFGKEHAHEGCLVRAGLRPARDPRSGTERRAAPTSVEQVKAILKK